MHNLVGCGNYNHMPDILLGMFEIAAFLYGHSFLLYMNKGSTMCFAEGPVIVAFVFLAAMDRKDGE